MKNGLHTAEVGTRKLSASDRVSFLYHGNGEIRDKIRSGQFPTILILFLKLNEVAVNSGRHFMSVDTGERYIDRIKTIFEPVLPVYIQYHSCCLE